MQRIGWYAVLAVVALVVPISGQNQKPPQMPRATVRELATIEGDTRGYVLLPGGRTLIYTVRNSDPNLERVEDSSTYTYDVATKRRTLLGTNMLAASVSPQGDRLAFHRASEDRTGNFLWTMPIDPKTGIATGQAQRVTLRPTGGSRGLFSPEGKMLVFSTGRPDGTWDVAVVPATGGVERVVANYPGRVIRQAWSADGQALYVETLGDPKTVIERVPVTGGRSEPLVPRSLLTDPEVVGLSPDAGVAFFQFGPTNTDFSYRTASGAEGEIAVALPAADSGHGYTFTLDSKLRYTAVTKVQNRRVRVLDLMTGKARDLLPGNVQTSEPAWSPDGRRIAVVTGARSHYDITIVNPDGSSPRRYSVPMHLDNWGSTPLESPMPWSPDGRFLAFRVRDSQKVGQSRDDQHQLALLDVNSGQTRVLTTSPGDLSHFVWRSDANAIRTIQRTVGPDGSQSRWSIVEIPLNGRERLLRDISAEFPGASNALFASDREAIVMTAPIDKQPAGFVVPLDSGPARRLPADTGLEPGFRVSGPLLAAGNQLFLGLVDAKGEGRAAKILSTVGNPTRTLRVPFHGQNGVFHPDGKQIIGVGKVTGDSVSKVFLIPLDGSPSRVVGEIPRGTGGLLARSPDGKLLAYTSDGIPTSKILEIDFGPALKEIVKR